MKVLIEKIDIQQINNNFDSLVNKLCKFRKEKALKFTNKKVACVSIAAGLLIQRVVGEELNISPDELNMDIDDNGKPYIIGFKDFHFNISHSGEYVAIAYGDDCVGIDIEEIKEKDLEVAKRCFCKDEIDYILGAKDINRAFFEIWTMKESYLKYTGTGIRVALNSFCVDPVKKRAYSDDKETDVSFEMKHGDDYVVAICKKGDIITQ